MMKTNRVILALCAGLAGVALASPASSAAQVDPATGLVVAGTLPQANVTTEPASAAATGVGLSSLAQIESVKIEATPSALLLPTGVLRGSAPLAGLPVVLSPEATGLSR